MELPVEIIEAILANVSFQDACKGLVGWLQHIYKKVPNLNCLKAIIVLQLLTPSILAQAADRDIHKKGTKKAKKDPIVRMRKYILVCKILSSAMLGNKHKEIFLQAADAYTLEVAAQLENATKELLAMEIDPSSLFHPYSMSVDEILEAVSILKKNFKKK